jgi:hypothetical protein
MRWSEYMANEFLKGNILEVVDNQIRDNRPKCTRVTLERLISLGYSDTQAREMIGAVLIEVMFPVLKYNQSFDEQEYAMKLNKLVIMSLIETQLKLAEMIPVLVEAGRSTKNVAVEISKKEEFDEFHKQRPPT